MLFFHSRNGNKEFGETAYLSIGRLSGDRLKGDERFWGDIDFVMEGLKAPGEEMERRYRRGAAAYDLEMPAIYAANLFAFRMEDPLSPGRHEKAARHY
jgi:hypothetical protein